MKDKLVKLMTKLINSQAKIVVTGVVMGIGEFGEFQDMDADQVQSAFITALEEYLLELVAKDGMKVAIENQRNPGSADSVVDL